MKAATINFFILILIAAGCMRPAVPESPENVEPLEVGETIPDVSLTDIFGHKADLRELVSERPTLLIFYRGGWCPYCNTHLGELAKIEDEIYDMGIQIVGISPDKPSYLKETSMEHKLDYQLLSDADMMVSSRFGLAYKVEQETIDRYKESGLDLAERSGYDHYLLPVPAAFLVDTDGNVEYRYFNPDYTVRVGTDELLRVSRELVVEEES